MGMRRRHRRFGRHTGVSHQVRAAQRLETVALGDIRRCTHILVQINRLAHRQHRNIRRIARKPGDQQIRIGRLISTA